MTDKNELVERHAPLVKRIAHHLLARLPASVLVDDLIQAGMIGLLEASRNFDGSKGASFETFAGIRIRGSMLDEIRKGDWTPRSVHKNGRAITQAIREVERETGRDARDVDVAEKLQVSIDVYHQMLLEVNSGKLIGIEDLGVTEDVVSTEQTKGSDTPFEDLLQGSFQKALAHA
ncbi:MAG: RNA polymerase sigma factor FliA, partial [Paraglaciecola sp.]|nr:RNA polymerase sigma factor FliA [Paraglaciecola sp.]